MSWTQRLKRVFQIDIERCEQCGGKVQIIASIEEPATIKRILEHLKRQARAPPTGIAPTAQVSAGTRH